MQAWTAGLLLMAGTSCSTLGTVAKVPAQLVGAALEPVGTIFQGAGSLLTGGLSSGTANLWSAVTSFGG